jgi:hypothetical protein
MPRIVIVILKYPLSQTYGSHPFCFQKLIPHAAVILFLH